MGSNAMGCTLVTARSDMAAAGRPSVLGHAAKEWSALSGRGELTLEGVTMAKIMICSWGTGQSVPVAFQLRGRYHSQRREGLEPQ
jgi:hypothetical protein